MRRDELEHLIRAAAAITKVREEAARGRLKALGMLNG